MTTAPSKLIVIPPVRESAQSQAMKKQLRVAAYCRVSTDDEEQLTSYEAQVSYYTDKITSNPDWVMAGVFADEGKTGTSVKSRKDFQRMIRQCRRGKIDLILTKSLSRFARNTLDTVKYTRELRQLGIPVIFEKENLNSISWESEFLLTLYGAFAQSESESISKNVSWGKRQAMKEGKVTIQYKHLLGYIRGADGKPEIVPDQAEIIRFIFKRYLAGDTLRAIKAQLEAEQIPYITGEVAWNLSTLQSILQNEKYCGDVIMQKTFRKDCISKETVVNTGQLPKYWTQNHHEAIVSREIFDAVQEETARRKVMASGTKKSAPTGLGKYSSKHALTGLLICGECGTPYRRVVWTQKGMKRPVWRCVNRLDHGKTLCKHSPTLDEKPLQEAVLAAVNILMSRKDELSNGVVSEIIQELAPVPGEVLSLADIERAIGDLARRFDQLMDETDGEESIQRNLDQFREISEQLAALKERRAHVLGVQAENELMAKRLQRAAVVIEAAPAEVTEWNESIVHQLVEEVKVLSKDEILVTFRNGITISQTISPIRQEAAS
ncbi:recombinase family protein [uncultured Oscillibacter sp.]|jgi:DNA invertase Pin-like site-specific DNA recombinase|uniref:recombinase family protein n=1 Tax=uncultured Oscillibacter sp. TaxID=876091 RepID=UPI002628244A|nr:recombinase family protein [uncultured Oscillibacter sp.]